MFKPKEHFNFAATPQWKFTLALMVALGFCAMAITSHSLWIDETYTALKAQQSTLPNWCHEMRRASGSDMQMPLYMIWIWVCENFFGSSEIALRAVNLFWFIPGLFALLHSFARRPQLQLSIFITVIFSPFAWYYLNEARPYAMQIGASMFLVAVILRWGEKEFSPTTKESFWVWGFATALVALSGASMLGM